MADVVARCPDCGREAPAPFAPCDWCGRKEPSRWWCAVCTDWRATAACPACAGGLGVPSEIVLGTRVVGTTAPFEVTLRNLGKKPVNCVVASPESGVTIPHPWPVVPAGGAVAVRGTVAVPPGPLGRRAIRLITSGNSALFETLLVLEAEAPAPRLEFDPALVPLRSAHPGRVVVSSAVLKNTGNVPLTAALSPGAAWLVVEPKTVALAPGESAEVKLRARSKKTDSGTRETKVTVAAGGAMWQATVQLVLPDPELTAEPVAFGDLVPGRPAFSVVVVRNVGRVRVDCTLATEGRWLRVTPARINLNPGREKTVRVRAVLAEDQDGPQTSELLVSSRGAVVLRVPVSATGKALRAVLRAVRRQRFRSAIGPPAERKFQVANDGDGRLELTATADVPWIGVATPALRVAPGKKRKLRYTVDLPRLPRGEHSGTITIESNGGTASVPVTVEVLDPNPILEVLPGPDLGLTSPERAVSAVVQVRNSGIGLLRVRAESEDPRNTVHPAEVDVPPGLPVRIGVTIPVGGLPAGEHEAAVSLTSNGGADRAVVRFRLTPERIVVPSVVDLGSREAGWPMWHWLVVRNTGQYPVTLRVRGADQRVKLKTDRVTLASLHTETISFYLDLPPDTLGPVSSEIVLEGRAVQFRVSVLAVARKVKLIVEPAIIDLDNLAPGAERPFAVSVTNVGAIPAAVPAVHVAGELEAWLPKATVHPGEAVTLNGGVRVNTDETGQQVWATLHLGHGLTVRCEANVVSPLLPRLLAAAAAAAGVLAGGALSVAVGWWLGIPVGLIGLLVGAWLFRRS